MAMTRKKRQQARSGRINSNLLKSMAALTLLLAIAYLSSSRIENLINGTLGSAAQAKPAQAATQAQAPAAPPAPSVVGHVVANADLALGREYIGRVEPMQSVLIKPRVSGQIESIHFKEGAMVKEGDLLFTIDSAQYQATVQLRKADLAKAEATLSRAVKYNDRLKSADKRSVSASDVDMAASDVQQNRAAVEQAKATLRLAQIDLGFTKITAPISGRIGRAEATKGNYVTPSGEALASIVQMDPIRVSYALPDKNYMDLIKEFQTSGNVYNTTLILADGTTYQMPGERDFEANSMDAMSGTMTVYLRFKNNNGTLIPGSIVRVATKPAKVHVAPVVPQEALLSDAGGDFVYVIDENDVAHRRAVSLGVEIGTSREIVSGLEPGEKVIMRGLQGVRPETPVKPNYPQTDAASKNPADLARESGFDLPAVSGDSPAEGKN
ncbi:MAG: efflux RND transporter periplasmic adaptor subunit [Synergistaceae bacterium]|jgi:RND family efflux transporter MFP subunit|nr:efflux RND transporter periplasmic adaptor subunit [Synergistaceae bacterium]